MSLQSELPTLSLIFAVIAFIINFVFTYLRTRFTEVKELEHRLTSLESDAFTQEERKCLTTLDVKMGAFWEIVVKEMPKLLKSPHTPSLDILLAKAGRIGADHMARDDRDEAEDFLNQLKTEETKIEEDKSYDRTRALMLKMVRGALEVELGLDEKLSACDSKKTVAAE